MESLTLIQLRDFAVVTIALLGAIVLIGNAWKTIKGWKEPSMDKENKDAEWKREVDKKLGNDNKRIESLEEGNKVVCKALIALLSHEINGNSRDKLEHALDGLNQYLIER